MLRIALVAVASMACTAQIQAQSITVNAVPTVSIGRVDGDPNYLLSRVSHVRRLSDERIMVVMGPDIRFYDRNGRHLSNAGGRGRGPGEFQHIQDIILLPGDTLLILHFRDKVWLAPDGSYIRQEAMDLSPLAADGWMSEGSVLLPDGNLLATQYDREEANRTGGGLHRPVLRYSVFDPARQQLKPLITAGGLRQIVEPGRGGGVQMFSPHAQHAIATDRLYVGDNDTTFISVYSLDGRHLGNIQVATRAVPVTSADLASVRAATLRRIGDDARRRTQFEQNWAAVPKPDRYPYWSHALVDRTGLLWVASYGSPSAAQSWTVFTQRGERLTQVTLPKDMRPREIGVDYILSVERDEFDVEYVRLYEMTRR